MLFAMALALLAAELFTDHHPYRAALALVWAVYYASEHEKEGGGNE